MTKTISEWNHVITHHPAPFFRLVRRWRRHSSTNVACHVLNSSMCVCLSEHRCIMARGSFSFGNWKPPITQQLQKRIEASFEQRCFSWHHHFNQLGLIGWWNGKKIKWTFLLHYDSKAGLPPPSSSLIGDLSGNNGIAAAAIKRNANAVGPLIMALLGQLKQEPFFIQSTSSICMFHLIWHTKVNGLPAFLSTNTYLEDDVPIIGFVAFYRCSLHNHRPITEMSRK